jgi:hypothetical protein
MSPPGWYSIILQRYSFFFEMKFFFSKKQKPRGKEWLYFAKAKRFLTGFT